MPLIRFLLFPLAFLYKLVTDFRNHLYNIGYKKSIHFDRCVVNVGNITVGGTGKTPMVEYLVELLSPTYHLSTLSRGYKRKTSGFRLAEEADNATTLGDEPYQFYLKYGDKIKVAVGEERALAIPEILFRDESIQAIILDDAYQHRSVTPDLNILLTDYNRPFFQDFVLPAGLLRESRKNARRADVVVVTKCPGGLPSGEKIEITKNVQRYAGMQKPVFFAGVQYQDLVNMNGKTEPTADIFLFTGIANGKKLEDYLNSKFHVLGAKHFPDHYSFNEKVLEKNVLQPFRQLPGNNKCLVTTEKDAVRIKSQKNLERVFAETPLFYIPIKTYFLDNGVGFDELVLKKVRECIPD